MKNIVVTKPKLLFAKCTFCALLVCIMLFTLSSCCLTYSYEQYGNFSIGYSKLEKRAYVAEYVWDGNKANMTIIIPDRYKSIPIRDLGGYYGKGVPCPFRVMYSQNFEDVNRIDYSSYGDDICETLVFTVVLGDNVSKIGLLSGVEFWSFEYEGEDGDQKFDIRYKVAYRFIVSETNRTFYAVDGKLYYKSDGSSVGNISYE